MIINYTPNVHQIKNLNIRGGHLAMGARYISHYFTLMLLQLRPR